MNKTAWLVNEDGFEEVEVLAENGHRTLKFVGGRRDGQALTLPPDGVPFQGFHPALYKGGEPPAVWRFKGRTLPLVKPADFANPEQARHLVPDEEPYTFLPHTTHVIDGILAGDHQLLFGGTGVGKTSLILQIAARIGQPVIRLNFNGQVSVSDLVGSVGFGKDGTVWNDGALPRAMRHGYWLVCDEIDFAPPDILSILYPVLESRPKLCLKEHDGEVVEAHPRFRVFATGNSIGGDRDGVYHGTQPLNAALLNRFTGHGQVIKVEPMKARQEREVLRARLPNLPRKLIRRACDFASRLRHGDGQNAPLLPTFSTRELIQFCTKMMLYRDPLKAAQLTFLSVVSDANVSQPIEQAIKLIFGTRIVIGHAHPPSGASPRKRSFGAAPAASAVEKPLASGRVASEVTDLEEMKGIWSAYRGNGGALSYEQIEKDARHNLRAANGNSAYRICKRHDALRKRGEATDTPAIGGA